MGALEQADGDHALSKRITGASAAATRQRMADIDRAGLPSVAEAKAMAQGMRRVENKRAATAYRIDNDAAVRAELEKTVAVLATPRSMPRSPAPASSAGQ